MNGHTGEHTVMELSGYFPIRSQGFGLPAYKERPQANAWYLAVSQVEGDRQAPIRDFELFVDAEPLKLPSATQVFVGDPWIDVFIWDGCPRIGTPSMIMEDLQTSLDQIAIDQPLSLLDLALATETQDLSDLASSAQAFLLDRFGQELGEISYREVVLKKGVLLEIHRHLDRAALLHIPNEVRNFEITQIGNAQFEVRFDVTITRLFSKDGCEALSEAIIAFGSRIGVALNLFGLEPRDRAPPVVPPHQPPRGRRVSEVERGPATSTRLFGLAREVGIDLGTTTTKIYARDRGVILFEPSVVAIRTNNGIRRVLAVGKDALVMTDRTPDDISVIHPMRDGAIVDLEVATEMIRHFIYLVKAQKRWFRPLDLVICVPSGSTSTERRAIRRAAESAGASEVFLIFEPLAAAIGADMPVTEPVGSMVVNVGGGTTEVAIIALRGLAYTVSLRTGGEKMDDAIVSYLRRHHNLLIGRSTAERIKKEVGLVDRGDDPDVIVRGRDLVLGVPKEIAIRRAGVIEALEEPVGAIAEGIKIALENAAPELASDILDQGIVLTGGGALLAGIDRYLMEATGLPIWTADDPLNCVANGMGRAMEDSMYRGVLMSA